MSVSYHLDQSRTSVDRGSSSNWRRPASEAHAALWHLTRAVGYLEAGAGCTFARRSTPPGALRQRRCELLVALGTPSGWAGLPSHRDTLLGSRRTGAGPRSKATCWHAPFSANNRGFASVVGAIDAEQLRFVEAALAAVGPWRLPHRARLLSVMGLEIIWDDPGLRRLSLLDEAVGTAAPTR